MQHIIIGRKSTKLTINRLFQHSSDRGSFDQNSLHQNCLFSVDEKF